MNFRSSASPGQYDPTPFDAIEQERSIRLAARAACLCLSIICLGLAIGSMKGCGDETIATATGSDPIPVCLRAELTQPNP